MREYSVSEQHSVDAELTKLKVEDPQSNSTNTCNYHSKGGFGHATMGVRSVSFLPAEILEWFNCIRHPYNQE